MRKQPGRAVFFCSSHVSTIRYVDRGDADFTEKYRESRFSKLLSAPDIRMGKIYRYYHNSFFRTFAG